MTTSFQNAREYLDNNIPAFTAMINNLPASHDKNKLVKQGTLEILSNIDSMVKDSSSLDIVKRELNKHIQNLTENTTIIHIMKQYNHSHEFMEYYEIFIKEQMILNTILGKLK